MDKNTCDYCPASFTGFVCPGCGYDYTELVASEEYEMVAPCEAEECDEPEGHLVRWNGAYGVSV